MNQNTLVDSKKWLSSAFKTSLQPTVAFARLSINDFHYPKYSEYAITLLEYAQLMSQFLLFAPAIYQDPEFSDDIFVKHIIFAAKLLNPGSFLVNSENNSTTTTVLSIVILSTLIKFLLFGYLIFISKTCRPGISLIVKAWKWVFRLQVRIIYGLVASFWVQIIISSSNDQNVTLFGLSEFPSILISSVLIAAEFILSSIILLYFTYILPNKNVFSAKTNVLESTTFIQKVIIQVLQMSFGKTSNSLGANWTFSIITFIVTFARIFYCCFTLPLYKTKALNFQAIMIAGVLALNIAFFFNTVLQAADSVHNIQFILIAWIIVGIPGTKFALVVTDRIISFAALSSDSLISKTPELLVHKISLIKQLRKLKRLPCKSNDSYKLSYLLNLTIESNFSKLLNLDDDQKPLTDLESKEKTNKAFTKYLEGLLQKMPKNSLIKLYLAYYYGKKLHNYRNAIKLITELTKQKSTSSHVKVTASLLLLEIQATIKHEIKEGSDQLDLISYVKSVSLLSELEEKILAQTELQVKAYNEILGEKPDLANIFNMSQEIKVYRKEIERKINQILQNTPDYNVNPLIMYAEYQWKINYSIKSCLNFYKIYQKKWKKFERYFKNNKLNEHSLYLPNTVFLISSAPHSNRSSIVFCSKSIEQVYGGDAQLYLGQDMTSITPPSLRNFTASIRSSITEEGNRSRLQTAIKSYGYHKEGYLIPTEICLDIFPMMTRGLFLMFAIRPLPYTKEYLLVRQNGEIECGTKKIVDKLGIAKLTTSSSLTNLRVLSEELFLAHLAFNVIGGLEAQALNPLSAGKPSSRSQNSTHQMSMTLTKKLGTQKDLTMVSQGFTTGDQLSEYEAKELFAVYSNEGKSLELNSASSEHKKSVYHCTIQNLFFSTTYSKIIFLTETASSDDGDQEADLIQSDQGEENYSSEMKNGEETYQLNNQEEEEKQDGWIEFDRLRSGDRSPKISVQSPRETGISPIIAGAETYNTVFNTVEENLISPKSSISPLQGIRQTTTLATRVQTVESRPAVKEKKVLLSSSRDDDDLRGLVNAPPTRGNQINNPFERTMSIASSQLSKSSHHKRISDAFVAALAIKSYSRSWICLILLFYIGIVAVFGIQLGLVLTLNNSFSILRLKKSILDIAQARRYNLLSTQIQLRLVLDLQSGRITTEEFGLIGGLVGGLQTTWTAALDSLVSLNGQLSGNCSQLEDYVKEALFEKNVRIYEESNTSISAESYLTVDSFQAIDMFAESALAILQLQLENRPNDAIVEFEYISTNSLNDLFINIEDTLVLLLDSISNQRNNISNVVNGFLIAILVWLGGVVLFFGTFLRSLYTKEKKNMFAVTKLNGKALKANLNTIRSFQSKLLAKQFHDENLEFKINSNERFGNKLGVQKEGSKKPIFAGIRKKYLIYLPRLLPFILTTVGFVVGNSVYVHTSVTKLQNAQESINSAADGISTFSMSFISAEEMFLTNDTSSIKNHLPSEELTYQINVMDAMRTGILSFLATENDLVDTEIQNLFQSDGCQYGDFSITLFCQVLGVYGQTTGVVNLLNVLQNLYTEKVQDYPDAEQSETELRSVLLKNFDLLISANQVTTFELNLVSSLISDDFENTLDDAKTTRNLIFIFFSLTLLAQSFILWFRILGKLKEVDNQFKNVLEILPAHTVLSNFLLKNFLVKTSNGVLDVAIKNNM